MMKIETVIRRLLLNDTEGINGCEIFEEIDCKIPNCDGNCVKCIVGLVKGEE